MQLLRQVTVALTLLAATLTVTNAKFTAQSIWDLFSDYPKEQPTTEEQFQNASNSTEIISTNTTQEINTLFGETNMTETYVSVETTDTYETITAANNGVYGHAHTTEITEKLPRTERDYEEYFEALRAFGYDYFDKEEVFTNTDPRCPQLGPDVPGNCYSECGFCRDNKVCCPTNCKGTQCMEPVNPETPKKDIKEEEHTTKFTETHTTSTTTENIEQFEGSGAMEARVPIEINTIINITDPKIETNDEMNMIEESFIPQRDFGDYLNYRKENYDRKFFDWKEVLANPDPRCPRPDQDVPGVCSFECGFCFNGRVCCPNKCGGTECLDPVKPQALKETVQKEFFQKLFKKNTLPHFD